MKGQLESGKSRKHEREKEKELTLAPLHLTQHGHDFYVLAIHKSTVGWGSYNPFKTSFPPGVDEDSDFGSSYRNNESDSERDRYNFARAVRRDTVQIPRRGYAVLRFRADNPGVWLFHCHILWHLANGMAMLVDVLGDEAGLVPHEALVASMQCP
jgi:FtsP/CotA-like multicopper oxidase with cupredoxin domain